MLVHKMTYKQFAHSYPQYHMPEFDIFLRDPKYVCRFTMDSIGQVVNLEIGYDSDNWNLE